MGLAVNPMGVEGQLEGGAVQGIRRALSEEILIDPDTGGFICKPAPEDTTLWR